MRSAAPPPVPPTAPRPRDAAVDQFRGLAIVMMVAANYLEHVEAVPRWLKHAPDIGLTVIDFIAPFFIFAIGLTWGDSVRRRLAREGPARTFEAVVRRSMALVGIGALFTIGETSYGFNPHGVQWGTLQAIGVASLLTAPALFLGWAPRLFAALGLLAAYQWALGRWWLEQVLASSHAGLPGSLSWTALLLLATVLADLHHRGDRLRYGALAVGLLLGGVALAAVFPVSKHRMSVSFDFIVCGTAALLFALVDWAVRRRAWCVERLVTWGKNSLALYVAHLFLLAIFLVPEARWWHVEAPLWQVAIQGLALLAVLDLGASALARRAVFLSL